MPRKRMVEDFYERWHGLDEPKKFDSILKKIKKKVKGSEKEKTFLRIVKKLEKDPKNAALWFSLGVMLSDIMNFRLALDAFDFVVALDPNRRNLWNARAFILSRLHKHDEATRSYRKALEVAGVNLDENGPPEDLISALPFEIDIEALEKELEELLDMDDLKEKQDEEKLVEFFGSDLDKKDISKEITEITDIRGDLDKLQETIEEEPEEVIEYRCPACGATISEETTICPKCDAEFLGMEELPEEIAGREPEIITEYVCPACGATISEEITTCPDCGAEFLGLDEVPGKIITGAKVGESIKCPGCGMEVDIFCKNCPGCGIILRIEEKESVFACPVCSEFIESSATSCTTCGAKFVIEEDLAGEGAERTLDVGDETLKEIVEETVEKPAEAKPEEEETTLAELSLGVEQLKKPHLAELAEGMTNGLTNGLRALKLGLTNGVTNGNGITNGLGATPGPLDEKRRRWAAIVFPLIIFILVSAPYILVYFTEAEEGINIDGRFTDWNGVTSSEDVTNEGFNENIDIVDYRVDSRLTKLSFYLKVRGQMLAGGTNSERKVDTVHIFIDSDLDPYTGYYIKGIGADYLFRANGWDGEVNSRQLMQYTEDSVQDEVFQDWNDWRVIGSLACAVSGSELEVQIANNVLNLKNHDAVDVLFYMQSWNRDEDYSDTLISNHDGVLVVSQEGIGTAHISGNNCRLLRLEMKALGADITVDEIRLERLGVGTDGDASSVKLLNNNNQEVTSSDLNSGAAIFTTPFNIFENEEQVFYVAVDIAGSAQLGNSIGFEVVKNHDIFVNQGTVSLSRAKPTGNNNEVSYIREVPSEIRIDGAFGDWGVSNTTINDDNTGDIDGDVHRESLDIVNYGVGSTDTQAAFYLKVENEMAGGMKVPYWNDVSIVTRVESEGEPEPGEPVIQPPKPPKTGEDYVYIFIDTISSIGYNDRIPINANYMIEVKGRHNKVINKTYYEFAGTTTTEWNWIKRGAVEVDLDTVQMEVSIDWKDIGMNELNDSFEVYFLTTDWENKNKDYSNGGGVIQSQRGTRAESLQEVVTGFGATDSDRFGWSVSYAGDVNDDGYPDIIVGAPYNDSADGSKQDAGAAYIFFGYPGIGSNDIDAANANVTIYGEMAGDLFGWDVSDLGNVNLGTIGDIVVGAPGSDIEVYDWGSNDVLVNQITGDNQQFSAVAVDSNGNSIVVWYDYRNGAGDSDIYAQKLNSTGAPQWGPNDVKVNQNTTSAAQYQPDVVVDSGGNAIIVWYDDRNGDWDIYAQKLDPDGNPLWNVTNDVKVNQNSDAADQTYPAIAVDTNDNTIIIWHDTRNGNYDIYAQKLNSTGDPQWDLTDELVNQATDDDQLRADVAAVSSDLIIVAWEDWRGSNLDIYAQRLNATGDAQWGISDKKVNRYSTGDRREPAVAVTSSGIAYVAWEDERTGMGSRTVYAQKLNTTGDPQWVSSDLRVSQDNSTTDQEKVDITLDSNENPIVAWQDDRNGNEDIFVQRLTPSGDRCWDTEDVKINRNPDNLAQRRASLDVDPDGYVIVAWYDTKFGSPDVFAQKYLPGGPDRGKVYVFHGRSSWSSSYDASSADVVIVGEIDGQMFGSSVSGAGNIDNSGYDDIVVGAPFYDGYDWWNASWQNRMKLTFDNSGQSETLVNFPVLVRLSSSNFDYSKAKSDGTDLRFIDADGSTELKYHIEHWDSSGYSYVWVNVTNIDAASSTDYIWMYYGNSDASDVQDESGTYDSDYVMVQHLDETSGTHYDSTQYGNDGAEYIDAPGTQDALGKIDGADDFDGMDDYVDCWNDTSLNTVEEISIEAWVKTNTNVSTQIVVEKRKMGVGTYNLKIINNMINIYIEEINSGTSGYRYLADNLWIGDGQWHHIVGTASLVTDEIHMYLDGVLDDGSTNPISDVTDFSCEANLTIGRRSTGSDYFNGTIDEVRISKTARSADWIRAQYLSMNNTFITFGVEETKDWWDSDWSYRKKLTFDNSGQSKDLVNFPVLVRLSSSNFDYSKAKSDGTDLRFIDADGSTELRYHIEDWNPSGYSYVWVNVTNIAASSYTDYIWIYYGNPAASDAQDESGTYDTNYVMVQHLEESPDDDVKGHYDSTSYNNDGTPINFTESGNGSTNAAGKIDGADDFYGGDNYVDCGNDESLNITGPITLETWIKPAMVHETGPNYGVMSKAIAAPYSWSWQLRFGRETTLTDSLGFQFKSDLGSKWVNVNQNLTVGQWYYVVGVFDGCTAMIYLDSVLKNTTNFSFINGSPAPFFIGQEGWDMFFNGTIDEVRVSNTARSEEWIRAQHLSMNNNFITYGPEETTKRGKAYIFFGDGSISKFAENADAIISGESIGDKFGFSVSGAGDVNNDGYNDIIIGNPYYDAGANADAGRIYIFNGSGSFSGNIDASTAYPIITGSAADDLFGWSVSNCSDVNDDGSFDDVIIGAPGYGSGTGRAYILFGGNPMDSTVDMTLTGENSGDRFGFSVSAAGDMNRDGIADVIIGAPYYDDGPISDVGIVYIFEGGSPMDSVFDCFFKGTQADGHFGWSVSLALNMDGGSNMVVVGSPHYDDGSDIDAGEVKVLVIPEYSTILMPIVTIIILVVFRRRRIIIKSCKKRRKYI